LLSASARPTQNQSLEKKFSNSALENESEVYTGGGIARARSNGGAMDARSSSAVRSAIVLFGVLMTSGQAPLLQFLSAGPEQADK
jgi:hypothetical protein